MLISLIQITVWATEDGKYDHTKEQENTQTMSIVKAQVIFSLTLAVNIWPALMNFAK